jgi:predicted GTPase
MDTIFKRMVFALNTLTIYRTIMNAPVMAAFRRMCHLISAKDTERAAEFYAEVYYLLKQADSPGLGDYLSDRLKYEETVYAKALRLGLTGPADDAAAERDIGILSVASQLTCDGIKRELKRLSEGRFDDLVDSLPEWKTGAALSLSELKAFYRQNGCGILARYRAFTWSDRGLAPVEEPDSVTFDQMVGYDWQRRAVLENTRALVAGKAVNNVLLYGDSGTGKSATVKSMLGVAGFERLSLIEVSKQCLGELPALMRELSRRPQKFILFIDDLSFEEADAGYSALKVILEGSLTRRPQNVRSTPPPTGGS